MRARHVSILFCVLILGVAGLAPAALAGPRADSGAGLPPFGVQMLAYADGSVADMLGWSTSYSHGTTAAGVCLGMVGGNAGQGYVTVFEHSGELDLQTRLTASDGAKNDGLGFSTAISGDTVVASALWVTMDGVSAQGAAYVFTGSAGDWSQQAKLVADDTPTFNENFGASVAVAGDTIAVGAPGHVVSGAEGTGAVYVFTRSGAAWTQRAVLTPSESVANSTFGYGVAIDGDTIIAGQMVQGAGGAAYVFTGEGATWTEQARLTASDETSDVAFGYECRLDGDTAVIADWGQDNAVGAVYVFERTGSTWSQQAELHPPEGSASAMFGHGLDVSGDLIVVGAPNYMRQIEGGGFARAAFLFTRGEDGAWSPAGELPAPEDPEAAVLYGWSAAVEHNTVAVGTPGQLVGEHPAQGAVYLYHPEVGPSVAVTMPGGRWQKRPATLLLEGIEADGGAEVRSAQYWIVGSSHLWTDAARLRVSTQGVTRLQVRAVDVNNTPGDERTVVVRVDTKRPRVVAGAQTASGGRVTRLAYRVRDHVPGCGYALVRLVVADARGHVLTRASSRLVKANTARTIRVRTGGLAPGAYRVAWRAVDAAGNFQRGMTVTTLTVR